MELYGAGNEDRMTGLHETSSYTKFTWGDGNRGESMRIPMLTVDKGKGYLEDRRPAANVDPYLVSAALVDVIVLKGENVVKLK